MLEEGVKNARERGNNPCRESHHRVLSQSDLAARQRRLAPPLFAPHTARQVYPTLSVAPGFGSHSFRIEKATVGGIKMRQLTSRKHSSRKIASEKLAIAVPDIRPSEFCAACHLIFGSYERRVFVGDKIAHLHCARSLSKPRAA